MTALFFFYPISAQYIIFSKHLYIVTFSPIVWKLVLFMNILVAEYWSLDIYQLSVMHQKYTCVSTDIFEKIG